MEIKSSQEFYVAGLARSEREETDLAINSEQAGAVHAAREQAVEGCAAAYGDSIGEALEKARLSGRTASFLEFYKGPLSKDVLGRILEAGTLLPDMA